MRLRLTPSGSGDRQLPRDAVVVGRVDAGSGGIRLCRPSQATREQRPARRWDRQLYPTSGGRLIGQARVGMTLRRHPSDRCRRRCWPRRWCRLRARFQIRETYSNVFVFEKNSFVLDGDVTMVDSRRSPGFAVVGRFVDADAAVGRTKASIGCRRAAAIFTPSGIPGLCKPDLGSCASADTLRCWPGTNFRDQVSPSSVDFQMPPETPPARTVFGSATSTASVRMRPEKLDGPTSVHS